MGLIDVEDVCQILGCFIYLFIFLFVYLILIFLQGFIFCGVWGIMLGMYVGYWVSLFFRGGLGYYDTYVGTCTRTHEHAHAPAHTQVHAHLHTASTCTPTQVHALLCTSLSVFWPLPVHQFVHYLPPSSRIGIS